MRPGRAIPVLICVVLCLGACKRSPGPWHDGTPLSGAVSMEGSAPGGPLACGYSYELLQRFAKSSGRTVRVRLASGGEQLLDSLRAGRIDVALFPYLGCIAADSSLVQIPADSCGVWVFPASREVEARKASEWLEAFRNRPDYPIIRQPFFDIYNPLKRVSADFICPYDSLLRVYADTLGWDWKLLAALIYQESKFRIEARSPMGASGLMQLLPDTARSFGCSNTLDPEENIRAGVLMLLAVEKRYRRIAAGPEELSKYTLAAYNAGTGRMRDCINYARRKGADVSRWDNVAALIPDLQHDSVAVAGDFAHGTFPGGGQTVSYVRRVRAYHQRYRHICP